MNNDLKCPNCGSDSIMKISVSPFTTDGKCRNCWHTDNIDQFCVEDEQERADQLAMYYQYD